MAPIRPFILFSFIQLWLIHSVFALTTVDSYLSETICSPGDVLYLETKVSSTDPFRLELSVTKTTEIEFSETEVYPIAYSSGKYLQTIRKSFQPLKSGKISVGPAYVLIEYEDRKTRQLLNLQTIEVQSYPDRVEDGEPEPLPTDKHSKAIFPYLQSLWLLLALFSSVYAVSHHLKKKARKQLAKDEDGPSHSLEELLKQSHISEADTTLAAKLLADPNSTLSTIQKADLEKIAYARPFKATADLQAFKEEGLK
ncbi:MAG: hypothetical protein ACON39_06740 [Coraliomargaritaceae bacterium]